MQKQETRNETEQRLFNSIERHFSRILFLDLSAEKIQSATNGKYSYLSKQLKKEFNLGIVIIQPEDKIPILVELLINESETKLDARERTFREQLRICSKVNFDISENVILTKSEIFENVYHGLKSF
ncbi:MAG: hypothetical protein AAFY50_06280 [Cyanobacteria bacterium J06648_1]